MTSGVERQDAGKGPKKRLLFLSLGPFYYPEQFPLQDKFALLSRDYCGDILAVVNDKKFRHARLSDFELHGFYLPNLIRRRTLFRDLVYGIIACVTVPYWHYLRHRYAAFIAPDPLVAGAIAIVLAALTGAKAVIEVNGQFESAFAVDSAKGGFKSWFKSRYTRLILPWVLRRADAVRLLYPEQVQAFMANGSLKNVFSFGDFVPIARFWRGRSESKYILFIGYPWRLKGVDTLILAFNKISSEFPNHSLKVVGYCPDKTAFRELAGGNPRIALCDPVEYPEIISLMADCTMFVLPSRTEAMGRVLLEAMAAAKPIVASNVDGIPFVIRHGQNGLLFKVGDVDDLANKIRTLLTDPAYARQLAENGFGFVHEHLSEARYIAAFTAMIERTTAGRAISR